jgi:hypothetical protein
LRENLVYAGFSEKRNSADYLETGNDSVTIADGDGIRFQSLEQRTILRQKFQVTALRTFEHDVAALRAVGKKIQLGEYVTIQLEFAAQALNSADGASHGLLFHLGNA